MPIATLGVAAVAWVVTLRQMNGMDMGGATELGSLVSFLALWVPMMAAMMLPGRFRRSRDSFGPGVMRSWRRCSRARTSSSGRWSAWPSTCCIARTALTLPVL